MVAETRVGAFLKLMVNPFLFGKETPGTISIQTSILFAETPSHDGFKVDDVERGAQGSPPPKTQLLAQSQLFDESAVTLNICALEVVQQVAALADELEQTTAGVEVLLVFLEVPGEAFNAGGEQSHQNFRGAGVAFMLGSELR